VIQIPENWDRKDKDGNPIEFDAFVNLHTHSFFSLLDGMPSPKSIADRTFKLGQIASCISDHGVMFSIVDHFLYTKEIGHKAIAAFEAYVVSNHKERTNEGENARQHLLLIAKNKEGYKKLSYWCSVGATDGFYYRPRIDDEVMAKTGGKDVIACSACLGGRIPQYILNDEMDKAEEAALYYKNFFEEFYLEIQPTIEPEQVKINMGLLELSRKLNIPMVATSDAHYLLREHSVSHDVLLCMQSQKLLSDPNRWRFPGDTYFVASRKDMEEMFDCNGHEVFPKDELEKALDNTVKIAQACTFELETDKHYLPNISIPIDDEKFITWHKKTGKSDINANYLRYLCITGLKSKGLTDKVYRERLDYELNVINDMGFNDYFLIYYDIMEFCRKANIPYGPGRGCFIEDSPVKLVDGTTKLIQNVLTGDIVVGHDEKPHKVVTTFEYDCNEEIVSLKTKNNKSITSTKDHKVYAIKKDDFEKGIREPQWYAADDLNPGDYIAELD
jgi:DNA polymerase-3 subunit alpha